MAHKGNYLGQHIFIVVICLVFLAVLSLVLLLPAQRRIHNLDREIALTQNQVEEQKVLHPLYLQLQAEQARMNRNGLPELEKATFTQEGISALWDIFGELARKAGLQTVSVQPVSESVSDRLQVNAIFTGPLPAFREFLLDLGTLSYVDHVEQVLVQEVVGNREYRVRMWLEIS